MVTKRSNLAQQAKPLLLALAGLFSLTAVMPAVADSPAQNVLSPYSDAVDVFVSTTPSNILVARENQVTVAGQPKYAEAHFTLRGTSQTTPSFMVTAQADFLKNAWSITKVQLTGTVPAGYAQPVLLTEDFPNLQFNDLHGWHVVLVKVGGGLPYAMTWTVSGTATEQVRPVLLPRFVPNPWVGPKRGWVVKLRDFAPAGGFDPFVAPFGVNNENVKKLIDPIIESSKKQSNNQVDLTTYEIKELYYAGPYNINASQLGQAALAPLGITAGNVGDHFEWASLTVYPQTIQSQGVGTIPNGCALYDHRRGNWFPDLTYNSSGAHGPRTLGTFFHELNHTHTFSSHPRVAWGCGKTVSPDGAVTINPSACASSGEIHMAESMGGMTNTLWLHPIHRAALGWLKGAQVALAHQTGVYELYHDRPDFTSDPTRPLLLQIPVRDGTGDTFYVTLPNRANLESEPYLFQDIEYLSQGVELSSPGNISKVGQSKMRTDWIAYSYNDESPYNRTISPGHEMRLLYTQAGVTTDLRVKNLDRLGERALVSIRFNNEPLPPGSPVLLAPSDLGAQHVDRRVELSWRDGSAVEAGYIVERRTPSDAAFQEIGRTAAYATSFVDYTLHGGTTWYRVRAWNRDGVSAYSKPASVEVPNRPPVFRPVNAQGPNDDQTATVGRLLQFTVTATDPEQQRIRLSVAGGTFSLSSLGASFRDRGNGTGEFSWAPSAAHEGKRVIITFIATDSLNTSADHHVAISVAASLRTQPVPAVVGDATCDGVVDDADSQAVWDHLMGFKTLRGQGFSNAARAASNPATITITDWVKVRNLAAMNRMRKR